MKKILAILLATMMIVGLGLTAWAAGEGSITVKNATYEHTYTAYKVFDATYDGDAVSYTTPAENASLLDDTLFGWTTTPDEDGNISVWALEDADEADIIDWIEDNYDKFGGTEIHGVFDDTDSTVTFSGLDFGYYYITSSLGTVVTIDTAAPDATVYDKNEVEPTDPVKTIVAVDGTALEGDLNKSADAHVGSTVDFKVTANTTNWTGSEEEAEITEEWELTDTPTNMEIDLSTVVVKFNGTVLTVEDDYTATIEDGKLTINVPMVDSDGNSIFAAPVVDNYGEGNGLIPIEVTYSATITTGAGSSPAKNEIPTDKTEVDTYMFKLEKIDGETDEPLPGAEFEIYNGETLLKFTVVDGRYVYDSEGTVTHVVPSGDDVSAVISGLDKTWDLTIKEVVVPTGYNPQPEDATATGSSFDKVAEGAEPSYTITVENNKGAELPSTGGIGTTIFYIVGGLLAVGAGVVLVTKKRMSKEEI